MGELGSNGPRVDQRSRALDTTSIFRKDSHEQEPAFDTQESEVNCRNLPLRLHNEALSIIILHVRTEGHNKTYEKRLEAIDAGFASAVQHELVFRTIRCIAK